MTSSEYLASLQTRLITCDFISSFDVIEEWTQPDRGYIRIRMWLTNGDFLEVAEYFILSGTICIPERYRYQWMDREQKQMHKRWDNVEHHPHLLNFPHHVHFQDGGVESGQRLSITELLDQLSEIFNKE